MFKRFRRGRKMAKPRRGVTGDGDQRERSSTAFSGGQLRARCARGETHSDLARVRAKTEAELEQESWSRSVWR
jgi:hypothetical protein